MRTNLVHSFTGKQNQFLMRLITLVVMAFTISVHTAYASASRYGRGIAYWKDGSPTAAGKVYVSVDNATAPSDSQYKSYNANGITAQKEGANTTMTFRFYAKANGGYKFTGWYSKNANESYTLLTSETLYTVSKKTGAEPSGTSDVYTDVICYAEFIKIVHYSFLEPEHGSYTITNDGVAVSGYPNNVTAEGVVHVKAFPDDGYRFGGWYSTPDGGVTKNYFSFDAETDLSFTDDATIGVEFMADNGNALFYVVNGDMHDNLTDAITQASSVSPKVVTVAQDGHLVSGNYTIPFGVTLLVQHNKSYEVLEKPEMAKSASTLSVYRRLTMMDGANITCNGSICVSGKQTCLGGGKASGYATGNCGVIDMSAGGHIELNSGANLYAWGFITGQDVNQGNNTTGVGTIVANSGAKVWEDFAVGDWRGGTACSNIQGSNFFPFQSYFIQNIEVPLTVKSGAEDKCYASVSGDGKDLQLSATMIGSSESLFKLSSGSVVRKWYDATTDLMCFELSGTANLDAVVVKGLPVIGTISSEDYYLPISSNMHIILTNSSVTLSKNMVLQPGAKVEIKNDANITIDSRANIFMYDNDDWGPYAGPNYYFHNYGDGILTTHKNRGNGKSKDLLDDAQFIVDGELKVTGKLYSTSGGADIMGNGGGHVQISSLPSNSTIDAFTSNGDEVSGGVAVKSANLHNDDASYTKSIASSTFYNVNGRWFVSGKQNEKSDHTYDFTYISSGDVSGTGGTNTTTDAVYSWDKTGLTLRQKWFNVTADGCANWWHGQGDQSTFFYNYTLNSAWHQFRPTETESVYGSSTNELYRKTSCTWTSLGDVDGDCLYTLEGVKTALVDGHFVALLKNDDNVGWHNAEDETDNYICFSGCNWHSATKYPNEEKAYVVDGDNYIWYNSDWLVVERQEPYFFDYDATNVKQYYSYEDNEWVLATPCVSVTDVLETRYFYFLKEAIDIANSKKNPTITILRDMRGSSAALSLTKANSKYIIDLNGHKVLHTVTGSGNSVNLLAVNTADGRLTITDNSEDKDGVLEITTRIKNDKIANACRGIALLDGSLILEAGNIKLSNTYTYTSTSNSGMIKGINIAAGKSFTMNGGTIDVESPYYARAINIDGSADANATVTINAGTVTANATSAAAAMGIYTIGGTLTIEDGVTINATTTTTTAYGIYVDASKNNYWGTLNMNGGEVNVTATTNTATGVYVARAVLNNSTIYRAVANINGGKFTVKALTQSSNKQCDGVRTYGTTTIAGGTFDVQASNSSTAKNATSAWGVALIEGTTTISKGPIVDEVQTPSFTVKAYGTSYGIQVAPTAANATTGLKYDGTLTIDGGTFNVSTTTSTIAYGVHVLPPAPTIIADGEYAGTYNSIASATINDGTFNVTAKTTTATGVFVERKLNADNLTVNRGTVEITGGNFTVKALTQKDNTKCDGVRTYGPTTITGGTFDVQASNSSTAKNATSAWGVAVVDGTTTIGTSSVSNKPEFTVKAYGTAYGVQATADAANATTGLEYHSDVTINNGKFDVSTTASTTAYGVLVSGITPRVIVDGDYAGVYYSTAKATIIDGTFNVKAYTTTAYGAYCSRGVYYDPETLEPHTVLYESPSILDIQGGTFDVSTDNAYSKGTTTDGVRSFGTTTISGGKFTIKPKTTTSVGVRAYAGKTTITGNPEFTITATKDAFGLWAGCEKPNAKTGLTYNGEIEINGGTFTIKTTSDKSAYGVYVFAGKTPITTTNATDAAYFAGNYASAGKVTVKGGEFDVTSKKTGACGIYVMAAVEESSVSGYPTATATPICEVTGGKFKVAGTGKDAVNNAALPANFTISGGCWGGDGVNTNLAKYANPIGKKVLNLRTSTSDYTAGYRYIIGEGGTVTWKNGTTTLLTEDYLKDETPAYTGTTPTKAEDAEYTYTHDSWTPTIVTMDNSDAEYSATFSQTENKYSVSIAAGTGGSVSPTSVNNIGCETASGDITATANTGYQFSNWTLPEGVTAADGYTANSNPIHIHATASGKTITANFEAKTYTVTLDNQSATTAGQASVTATYNAEMPSIASNLPAKTGYTFGGYFTETNGGGTKYYNADGTSATNWNIDAATTLYAQWTINQYTISFDSNGGSEVASITQDYNTSVTAPADPTREGYTFAGWTPEVPETMPAEDTECVAQWTPNTNTPYVVKHYQQNIADDNYTEVTTDRQELTGTTATEVTPAVNSYTGFTAPSTQTVTILADGSLVVQYYYTRNSYSLTWDANGGELSGEYTSGSVKFGTSIIAPTATRTNYDFDGWDEEPATTMPAEDKTYTAQWSLSAVTILWKSEDGTETLETDDLVLIGATPSFDGTAPTKATTAEYTYTFDGWSSTIGGDVVDPLPTVSAATTYYAHFTATANVASMTVGGATTYYADFATAWEDVNSAAGTVTLKLLKDVEGIATSLAYTNAQNCTFDLNNHTLSGTVDKLIDVNASGKTFTIDDSSTAKKGKISTYLSTNARLNCVYITAGIVKLKKGTIYSENPHKYSTATANKSSAASAVYVVAGQKFTMDDGTIESVSQYSSYGLFIAQSTTSEVTINGGLIKGRTNASTNAGGIYNYCTKLTINGGHIIGHAWTSSSYGINLLGKATINGGIIEATNDTTNGKGTTTAYGIYTQYKSSSYKGVITIPSTSTVQVLAKARTNTAYAVYISSSSSTGHTIAGGTFTAKAKTGKTAGGVYSFGTITISGGTFNVSTATTGAYGIYTRGTTTTVNGNPIFHVTSGSSDAYGAFAYGYVNAKGTSKTTGTIKLNGGTFNVKSTTKTAYGAYAGLYGLNIVQKGTTANDTVFGQHYMPGILEITNGTFNVRATTTGAYGIVVAAAKSESGAVGTTARRPKISVFGGKFKAESEDDANATAYAMNTSATASYLVVQGGQYNTKKTGASTNIENKYTQPTKTSTNYWVLNLPDSELPYKYEVAEAYTITFKNGDETIQSGLVKKGTTPVYSGETPTKAADAQYTYTFNNWSPALTNVTAAATYTATFTQTVNTYTITWKDGDGKTLKTEDVAYGETPSYSGETPTKTEDANYTYTFNGTWSPAIVSVTEDATYTAQFDAVSKETGYYVDIVDVDNSAKTLTLNVTGWASGGWGLTGYVVNGTSYLKTDREADRTLIIQYTGEVGESFSITVVNADGETVSKHNYIIPAEITSTANLASQQIVFVKNNATLTVNANTEVKNIYVAPGSKLVISEGVELTADTVFLRTTPWASAQLENNGTLVGQLCYTRIIKDKTQYYQFGLPFPCDISTVRLSDGTTPTYNSAWILRSYSESNRAEEGAGKEGNWETLVTNKEGNIIIQGGVGYEMFSGSGYYREFYFPVTLSESNTVSVSYTANGKAGEQHAGWNILTSPLTSQYTVEPMPEGWVINWLQEDGTYSQEPANIIRPAIPFSYQAKAAGTITFGSELIIPLASRRRAQSTEEAVRIQWIHLDVQDVNSIGDETSIYSHPTRYEEAYKTGIDVAKQSFEATRALIYSTHAYGEMAFAGVSDELLEKGIPLTLYSPAEQKLTISMRENRWLDRMAYVWLVDKETGARTDLLMNDYRFVAPAGTTTGRFYLEGRFFSPQITTDLQNDGMILEEKKAEKLIIEDKMYIRVNGKLYDATGKLVK